MEKLDKRQQWVVRGWAGYDLALTGLLVLPPLAAWFLGLLMAVNDFFGGTAVLPGIESAGLLFVCATGALGVVWAAARLQRPNRLLASTDVLARVWLGGLIVYFVFARGVPAIFLLFTVSEWAGGIHQAIALARKPERSAPRVSPTI